MKDKAYQAIFCDSEILVLSKKSGIAISADRYDKNAPRLDFLAEQEFGKLFLVHRLDRETSGVIIFARNAESHKNLCEQFENRSVQKIYCAIIRAFPTWDEITVTKKLLPDSDSRHRTLANDRHGKESETTFRVIARNFPFCWIEAFPKTGRTHQIRAHLKTLGISIICDSLYGDPSPLKLSDVKSKWHGEKNSEKPLLSRLALHAKSIKIHHPKTKQILTFTANLPKDLRAAQKQLNLTPKI